MTRWSAPTTSSTPTGRRRAFSPCQHPAYDRAGAPLGPPTHEPQVNGWVASLNSTSQGAITSLGADWIVPPTPSSAQNQTLFFFPGVEPAATGDVILQPVLAWNGFGDHAWTIASWACCKDGNVFNSAPVNVTSGHKLTGTLTGASCSGGVCANWTITTKDDNTAWATTFAATADGEQMSWVFGGAMEIYGVDTCTEYPGSTSVGFTNIQLRNTAGSLVLPAWNFWSCRVGDAQLQPPVREPAGNRPERDDPLGEADLAVSVGRRACGPRVDFVWTRGPRRHSRSCGGRPPSRFPGGLGGTTIAMAPVTMTSETNGRERAPGSLGARLEDGQVSLVGRCVSGEADAWRALHGRYHPIVAAYLRRLGVREGELEDACQEVFLQTFRYLPAFRGDAQLPTWLYRLCVTEARKARQR